MPEPAARAHQPKNIIICCDGTGNEFGDANSNVVKLYTACLIGRDKHHDDLEQVGYYHPGVGTMGSPTARGKIEKEWSRIKGLAFGAGFRDNVLDAYRYLMEVYNDGDQVYLFGFSRGAYTARALSGLLHGYGLLCRGNEGHIPYAWRMFTDKVKTIKSHQAAGDHSRNSVSADDAFKETFSHQNFNLHFVGLWDTVSSVGWITTPLRLLYTARNPTVRTARHAVSIDERRCFFRDNLYGPPYADQDVIQVWFAGVHSDVGGSYPQCESALANIALDWILQEAKNAGLRVDPQREDMIFGRLPNQHPPEPCPTPEAHAKPEVYARREAQAAPEPQTTPFAQQAPINRPTPPPYAAGSLYFKPVPYWPIHKSLNGAWWILEFLPHRYYDKRQRRERWRIPMGVPRHIPPNSIIHPSVVERMNNHPYAPPNLPQSDLAALTTPPHTSADLSGYYVYKPDLPAAESTQPASTPDTTTKAVAGTAAALALLAAVFVARKLL